MTYATILLWCLVQLWQPLYRAMIHVTIPACLHVYSISYDTCICTCVFHIMPRHPYMVGLYARQHHWLALQSQKSTNLFVLVFLQASLQLSVGLLCLSPDCNDLCLQVSPLVDESHQPTNHTATEITLPSKKKYIFFMKINMGGAKQNNNPKTSISSLLISWNVYTHAYYTQGA